jgi:hypothetical protein
MGEKNKEQKAESSLDRLAPHQIGYALAGVAQRNATA